MSWNGTVRCSWCYKTGHNKRSCPERKAYVQEAPDSYEAKMLELEKKRSSKPRACSYCGELGHNRRSCKTLKSDVAKISDLDLSYRRSFVEHLKEAGLGIGSLIARDESITDYDSQTINYRIIMMVTDVIWDRVNIKYASVDFDRGSFDTSYHERNFLATRIVSVNYEDPELAEKSKKESPYKWRYAPQPGKKSAVSICDIGYLIPGAFPRTNFEEIEKNGRYKWRANVIGGSKHVSPPHNYLTEGKLTEEINKFFNFVIHGNTEWEKERTTRVERYLGYQSV